jgi:hypothetical protein
MAKREGMLESTSNGNASNNSGKEGSTKEDTSNGSSSILSNLTTGQILLYIVLPIGILLLLCIILGLLRKRALAKAAQEEKSECDEEQENNASQATRNKSITAARHASTMSMNDTPNQESPPGNTAFAFSSVVASQAANQEEEQKHDKKMDKNVARLSQSQAATQSSRTSVSSVRRSSSAPTKLQEETDTDSGIFPLDTSSRGGSRLSFQSGQPGLSATDAQTLADHFKHTLINHSETPTASTSLEAGPQGKAEVMDGLADDKNTGFFLIKKEEINKVAARPSTQTANDQSVLDNDTYGIMMVKGLASPPQQDENESDPKGNNSNRSAGSPRSHSSSVEQWVVK